MPAIDGDVERSTYFVHSIVAKTAQPLYENANRNALDGVEIDCGSILDRILAWLQDHLAWSYTRKLWMALKRKAAYLPG